ncbi:uncharacterized protein RMCT_1326, partial [Mycolicibacterium thermoresistibile]
MGEAVEAGAQRTHVVRRIGHWYHDR